MKFLGLSSILLALSVAACGGVQKESLDRGEPLVSVSGAIASDFELDEDLDVSLLWQNQYTHKYFATSTVPVVIPVMDHVPAEFRLDMFAPPPAEALNDYTRGGERPEEVRIGVASIVMIRGPATDSWAEEDQARTGGVSMLGFSTDFVLVYVDNDVKPNTTVAKLLHGTPAKGFHVMRVLAHPDEDFKHPWQPEACLTRNLDECGCQMDSCVSECYLVAGDACVAECKALAGDDMDKFLLCQTPFDLLFEAEQGLKTKVEIPIHDESTGHLPNWSI